MQQLKHSYCFSFEIWSFLHHLKVEKDHIEFILLSSSTSQQPAVVTGVCRLFIATVQPVQIKKLEKTQSYHVGKVFMPFLKDGKVPGNAPLHDLPPKT